MMKTMELVSTTMVVFKVINGKKEEGGGTFLVALIKLSEQMEIFIVSFLSTL